MGETELIGRFEALATAVMRLTARLEIDGIIDGPRFSQELRGSIAPDVSAPEYRHVARQRLHTLVDQLDAARAARATRDGR